MSLTFEEKIYKVFDELDDFNGTPRAFRFFHQDEHSQLNIEKLRQTIADPGYRYFVGKIIRLIQEDKCLALISLSGIVRDFAKHSDQIQDWIDNDPLYA